MWQMAPTPAKSVSQFFDNMADAHVSPEVREMIKAAVHDGAVRLSAQKWEGIRAVVPDITPENAQTLVKGTWYEDEVFKD